MKHYIPTIFFIALATVGVIIGASRIYAAGELQKIAEKYNITFPIQELGGCTNLGECRQFCEDPINQPTCIAFAKTKGFYKGDIYKQKKATALSSAQNELGCNSEKTCKEFCQQSENQEKCNNFAKKYTLRGGITINPQQANIITEAKTTLGCTSPTTCADFCAQDNNKQKCSNFAKQTGLSGGEVHQGPGGCTSESSCKEYCNQHPQECHMNIPSVGTSPTGIPNSPTPSSVTSSPPSTSPTSAPSNQIIDCTGPDGKHFQATQQDCDNFNKAWGKAPAPSSGSSGSSGSSNTQTYQNLSTGPTTDCTGPDGHHFQATQAQCDYFNNAWKTASPQTGTSGSSGSSTGSSGGPSGTSGSTSTSGSSGSTGGCDSACQQSYCSKTPGCSWSGGTCKCTHGISTNRNVFQLILDFIFTRL